MRFIYSKGQSATSNTSLERVSCPDPAPCHTGKGLECYVQTILGCAESAVLKIIGKPIRLQILTIHVTMSCIAYIINGCHVTSGVKLLT